MSGKTAIVFGASGLVGGFLVDTLLQDSRYAATIAPVRRTLQKDHPQLKEIPLENFEQFDFHGIKIPEVQIFCCLGTTIKKAKTREAFRNVDYDLPVRIARWAKNNGIETFIVVSSIGATSKTGNFYLRTKGEMEEAVIAQKWNHLHIVRPSLLLGKRNESRFGEGIAQTVSKIIGGVFIGKLRKYRPIEAKNLAKAMVTLALSDFSEVIIESDRLQDLAKKMF